MLRSFVKTACAVLAITGFLHNAAKADWTVKVTTQNTPITIEVESDGEAWTNIKTATKQIKLSTEVKVSSGWRITKVYLGLPNADLCRSPAPEECIGIYAGKTKHVKLDGRIFAFVTHQIGGLDALAIVNACNAGGHDPTQERSPFASDIGVGIKAFIGSRREANEFQEGDFGRSETAYARVPVIVRCLAGPSRIQAPPTPYSVDVQIEQKGKTCPRQTDVMAVIKYKVPATARFRFKVDGESSELHTIKARKISDGRGGPIGPVGQAYYLVKRLKTYDLDPGTHRFRVELEGGKSMKSVVKTVKIDCPPFKVTSAWLKYEVEDKDICPKRVEETATFRSTRPGKARFEIKTQGGLVVNSGEAKFEREGMGYVAKVQRPNLVMNAFDQDMMALIKDQPDANSGWVRLKVECVDALSGTLTLKGLGATSCKGEALVAIHTNGAGEVPYELECGPGRSWQRNVTAHANNMGVDKLRFDVTNNERVTCVLRTRSGNTLKSLDGASKAFRCHKPVDVSGSTDFVPETRDEPQGARKPERVADPVRTCAAGTVGKWPKCKKQVCPRGQVGKWPKCKKQVCPRGTVGKWPNCKKQVCPRGQVGKWPNCKKQVCPHGTVGKWPKCKKQVCPRGQVGKWPNCRKRGCPPGQVRVRGRCIKPAG